MAKSKRQIIAELTGLCARPISPTLKIRMLFWRQQRLNRVLSLARYHVKVYGKKIQN
tara:strand:+ start:60 stop:230 length:171 start_codon:yes stop_codon:yes gene_type:complete